MVWASGPPGAAAQGGSRTVEAVAIPDGATVAIDGRLSEPIWANAQPADDFRQQDPQNGAPATERTEVRVLYDATRLIVGVTCLDREPGAILANQLKRDQSFAADDRFMMALDSYADGRSGYYFEINAAGAMGDGLITQTSAQGGVSINRSWDGLWTARVVRTGEGWTAEIEIPFRTISFQPAAPAWGVNFQRTVRRKNEEQLWSGWARNQGLTFMSAAGHLLGVRPRRRGPGWDVRPYVTGSESSAPGRGATAVRGDVSAGGDAFFDLTPGLRSTLTVNTDFAETEVDQRQVNLTRFPLFFPEKRAFFLEGTTVFDFAREQGNTLVPFFSRRIGLDENGQPQPITYGAKLTGQVGAYDLGVLQAGTRRSGGMPGEQFTALRARRRLGRQSALGGVFTNRSGADGRPSRTVGVDAVAQTSSFLGAQVLELSGWALWTTPRVPGDRSGAYGFRVNYPNDRWNVRVYGREVQAGFDPAMGFVARRAYRELSPDVRLTAHPNARVIRRVSWEVSDDRFYGLDGRYETGRTDLQLARVELQTSDVLEFHIVPSHEFLPSAFAISQGVTLPAGGDYDVVRRVYQVQTAARRLVAVTAKYEDGGFYSGTRRQATTTVSWRPVRGWALDLTSDLNRVRLREGRFATRLWRADLTSQFSPWVGAASTVQYDSVTRSLGWQSRFRWIQRPGNDVYVVLTRNWLDLGRWTVLDQKLAAKLAATVRF